MSNDCSNRIEIRGNKEVITRMFDIVKSEARDWGKEPSPNLTEKENRKWLGLEFDFNKVVPYPEEFAKLDAERERQEKSGVPYGELPDSGFSQGGYEWCLEHWGTKWNATNASTSFIDPLKIEEAERFMLSDYENPAYGEIYFTTAWSPAFHVTEVLSKQFPELTFTHNFEEEGLIGKGYQVWRAGILLAEDDGTSVEVVIDNPVLLKIMQKYKDMGIFDLNCSDFSVGNYEYFDSDLFSMDEEMSKTPALAVGLKKEGYCWDTVPFELSDVVGCILESLDRYEGINENVLFEQLKDEVEESIDEINTAFGQVIWKYGGEVFTFERGEESYTVQNDGEVEEEEWEEEDDDQDDDDQDDDVA